MSVANRAFGSNTSKTNKRVTQRGQVNATLRPGAFSLQASPLGHGVLVF